MPTPENSATSQVPPRPAIADEESLVATLTLEELHVLLDHAKSPEEQDELADGLLS